MKPLTVGALCAGYGGLEAGLAQVLDTELAFVADNDPGAAAILAHHHPDVPNLGDITKVRWEDVARVDILAVGFPCTDVSLAGRREGLRAGTRSGVWNYVARAIDIIRPKLVVIENVRGLLNARADSDMEPCPWCVGDPDKQPPLRALGAVLGDLAELGFDAEWRGVRAADVGAPHSRFRVFIVARPAADAAGYGRDERWTQPARIIGRPDAAFGGAGVRPAGDVVPLLPTPAAADAQGTRAARGGDRSNELLLNGIARLVANTPGGIKWGKYEPAIRRWEAMFRPVPDPTVPAPRGGHRLNPAFSEWMMGIPAGHVTAVPGLTRNQMLTAIGNGVVPAQSAAALRLLLAATLDAQREPAA